MPLTAYVLIALLEAGVPADAPIVTQTTRCVSDDTTRDPYTIALKAYALALAGHPRYTAVLQQLLELAVEDDEGMYWELQRQFCESGFSFSLFSTILPKNRHLLSFGFEYLPFYRLFGRTKRLDDWLQTVATPSLWRRRATQSWP